MFKLAAQTSPAYSVNWADFLPVVRAALTAMAITAGTIVTQSGFDQLDALTAGKVLLGGMVGAAFKAIGSYLQGNK